MAFRNRIITELTVGQGPPAGSSVSIVTGIDPVTGDPTGQVRWVDADNYTWRAFARYTTGLDFHSFFIQPDPVDNLLFLFLGLDELGDLRGAIVEGGDQTLIRASEPNGLVSITGDRVLVECEAPRYVGTAGNPPYHPSWSTVAGYEAANFFKDPFGIVHVSGVFGTLAGAAYGQTIFTLPAGYRPSLRMQLPNTGTTATYGTYDIRTTGAVVPLSGAPMPSAVAINVTFPGV